MNLNALKAQRKGLRTAFSNCLKKIESELAQELCNFETLSVLKIQFNDKFARMDSCQNAISETLLLSDDGEHLFAEDLEDAEIYREKFWELTTKIELKSRQCTVPSDKESRKFKLPKIELKKFNGEAKEYLTFWSQFQKIHEDRGIAAEDNMQYLLQSMEPGSKADRLVLSFPATAANYPKAIDQLKERFGREDLLVQIYVRDLLTLVMKNAATGRAKADLPLLYDELESKLRSLESLGKTQDKYGDFLTPLVESCLPEEVLVAWERSRNHQTESEGSRSLEQLMNFLRQEVKGEEMVLLARTGLTFHQYPRKKDYHATQINKVETTTAAALVNMDNPEMKTKSIPKSESSLSNSSKSKTVFLQTLCVIIRCQGQEKLIRAVIDSGSQSTYVSENVITHLKALPLRSETVIHALFGGSETKPKKHDIFPVEVSNLNKTYTCSFEALSEKMICGYIPKIEDKQVLNELKRKKIKFTDSFRGETEINLSIGADVLGKLLTGNSVELKSGVTVVETKLENCQPQHEEVAQKLKSSFYVDNCVSGVFNTDEQGRFIEHAKLIMLNGCFNLRGFESNVAGKNIDRSSGDTSVLGVIWNLETDTLKCCTDMDTLTCETKITKRLILAIVQKIFDPIGLLTPATLLPKLLIQHLWKMKIAWDSELSPKDVNVFLKWFRDLYVLKDVTLSRCMIINSTSELHVFVDASKEAYAACVFVRSMFKSDVKVTLVRAKARVAPFKAFEYTSFEAYGLLHRF
ncbi:uncharacterized protein TNCV_1803281 [Trichonephila clavipes]|uniref:Peptidase aspartic putative domain-containing protein n=1 Tax=Trichonephila clavipes TaxID=2585209 RepID=A0A8X6SGL7_TRICX|nr:uncharacterized protein TNCV_1803281 [Trichonephila clavipes]